MTTCYHHYIMTDKSGECDAFFLLEGKKLRLIWWFNNNDADYREEYMDGLFKKLGVEMLPLPKKYRKQAEALVDDMNSGEE